MTHARRRPAISKVSAARCAAERIRERLGGGDRLVGLNLARERARRALDDTGAACTP
jgi:hypothetical protein